MLDRLLYYAKRAEAAKGVIYTGCIDNEERIRMLDQEMKDLRCAVDIIRLARCSVTSGHFEEALDELYKELERVGLLDG